MNGPLPPLSDEDLHAFNDGELDAARRKATAFHLAASPADAARAEAWRRQSKALRDAFADVTAEPPFPLRCELTKDLDTAVSERAAMPVHCAAARDAGSRRRVTSAALCLAFVAGAATTFGAGVVARHFESTPYRRFGGEPRGSAQGIAEPLVDRALRAVVAFEPAPGRPTPETATSARVLVVPNLSDAGLSLAGLRAMSGAPSPVPCLVYVTPSDAEVTLCIDSTLSTRAETLDASREAGNPFVSWQQKGSRYSLAGPVGGEELDRLAERARAEIDKFASRPPP